MDKEILKNKLLNRIYLENIRETSNKIREWKDAQDKDLMSILLSMYKFTVGDKSASATDLYQKSISDIETSLSRHLSILAYEFGNKTITPLTGAEKNQFSNIKDAISKDDSLKTLDQNNIMKILRQTLAHNTDSIPNPNWTTDISAKTFVSKPLKNNQVVNMELDNDNLHKLFTLYFVKAYNNFSPNLNFDANLLIEKMKKGSINIIDIKNIFDKDNTLDSYQIKALYNLCQFLKMDFKNTNEDYISAIIYHISETAFPHKNNALNNFFINSFNLAFINSLISNPTAIEYKKQNNFRKFEDSGLADFLTKHIYQNIEHGIILNSLFYLFSVSTPDELEKYFKSSKLYTINPAKLRNSVIHGRYYYNYNNGYEFYDGQDKNNLQHIASIKVKHIDALLKHIFHEQIHELKADVLDK